MSGWAQTGFPEVCKGTTGSVCSVSLKKQQGRVETRDLGKCESLLMLFAPLSAAELFEKVYLDANLQF